jgi:methionyl-tRNA synthetase
MLGQAGNVKECIWDQEKLKPLTPGQALGTAQVLFAKIEDEQIDKEIAKLNTMMENQAKKTAKPEVVEQITIEDFKKVQLKVAEIIKAEPVKKSQKLLKLQVSLGNEQRQILAGIKEAYPDPQVLVGKKVVVVANLKPAKLMGRESNGMLLAAHDGSGLHIITPDSPAEPGSIVS